MITKNQWMEKKASFEASKRRSRFNIQFTTLTMFKEYNQVCDYLTRQQEIFREAYPKIWFRVIIHKMNYYLTHDLPRNQCSFFVDDIGKLHMRLGG